MTAFARCRRLLIPVSILSATLLVAPSGVADQSAGGQPDQPLVMHTSADAPADWAAKVWESALSGNRQILDKLLLSPPPDAAVTGDIVARYRESYGLRQSNAGKAVERQTESRAEAEKELRELVAKSDVSQALRAAVKVQTFSDSFADALQTAEVKQIIATASDMIPRAEKENDWLQAQELLYYLRTLYEDTGHAAEYQKYHEELDAVNRRVALLAQYAPRRLHDLRNERAKRMGEPGDTPFNPAVIANRDERVEGVTPDILRGALRTAAMEHIENAGWRPLLHGGLEELKLLATTSALDETFPLLRDAAAVNRWAAHIDAELATLAAARDVDLDSRTLSRMIDGLLAVNAESVQLPKEVLYREFGDGATFELDPFSEIIWPDKLPRFRQATEGNFVGVGILIQHNEAMEIKVVNPLEGTPAYFGGVKPADILLEVDGLSTVGWSLNDAVDRITGDPGTQVNMLLRREGEAEPVAIPLTREVIKIRSVMGWWKENLRQDGTPVWNWYVDPVSRIAYVRLTQFSDDTYRDLKEAWKEIVREGRPNGLILDLRFNPGGLLTSAVQISNLFLRQGVIVTGEYKDGVKAWPDQKADPRLAALEGVPTVVLINQGSASASEIVAGCLQAYGTAVIVGERSFGKGSVQTVHQIAANARMKLTTQYYRLPETVDELGNPVKGRLVHKRPGASEWGVDPDVLVKMTPDQVEQSHDLRQLADIIPQDAAGVLQPASPDRPDITKLLAEGMDPQLETALLLLQARALKEFASDVKHASKTP